MQYKFNQLNIITMQKVIEERYAQTVAEYNETRTTSTIGILTGKEYRRQRRKELRKRRK